MRDDYPARTVIQLLDCFAPLFSWRIWQRVTMLVVGTILAPGKRTVTACLRVMGLSDEVHFQNHHRLLTRIGAKIAAYNVGILVNRQLGRPDLALATLIV